VLELFVRGGQHEFNHLVQPTGQFFRSLSTLK
jgi:hypothetical protein